ncbi:uncharacterized protein SPAPADRAFT_134485 [Spathaspora passalidarum NRRL Y-27907]|uniref:Uncharacterized protein n=1 Tax=Spathaspora passalidarum (strain NRRL Y-27907 / 11-Y1) TaxID=619300 RepID=G3AI71_SPAPN|nr:uncharacterized protein SPAPADRAFT_134485 [Spathaspora passalidarum NRRL Y-27907]EGW34386.1 hypothetical protein SPAPADRAFT_134485 [Spathaspora passalidarum NRRL Y-27907]
MAVHSPHYVTRQLFQCGGVSLYKISPGATSNINSWDLTDSNQVWSGFMRFCEQEAQEEYSTGDTQLAGLTVESSSSSSGEYKKYMVEPFQNLRAKIEFYNRSPDSGVEEIWAETWYNPLVSIEYDNTMKLSDLAHLEMKRLHTIAHDNKDTILEVDNSDRHFRVVVQLPGTGYHPYLEEDEHDSDLIQVALGLQIKDLKQAYRFAECLEVYNSRYGYAQHSYYYDRMLYAMNSVSFTSDVGNTNDSSDSVSEESVSVSGSDSDSETDLQGSRHEEEDDEDDEFGDFVTS